MMNIASVIKFLPNFINCSLTDLLTKEDISYTGFYVPCSDGNNYYFKSENDFYIVKARRYEDLEKVIVDKMDYDLKEKNKHRIRIIDIDGKKQNKIVIVGNGNVSRTYMSIYDLVNLYKHNNNIRVSDCFYTTGTDLIHGNYKDFLSLVRNVLKIEQELSNNNIDKNDKYRIMKYIYNKYKLEAYYWNPNGNYRTIKDANSRLLHDSNRVLNHPFDYLGLINDKYATCEGMADGLVELYRYFGIDACMARNRLHAMCKINLRDTNGERHVTYIDLSREVTNGFQDNKYEYINGRAIPRRVSNRIAAPNSYNYFMRANVGKCIDDSDLNIAVDYKPPIKIYFDDDEIRHSNRR